MDAEQKAAHDMIRSIHESGEAEINGRTYTLTTMTHKQRRKVFAFYSQVGHLVENRDFSFLDAPAFEPVETVINKVVTFDGSLLSVLGDKHWEAHPDDYLPFIGVALAAISFPFLPGSPTA